MKSRSKLVFLYVALAVSLPALHGCRRDAQTTGNPKLEGHNVLFISLDTTRFDRLGCYGYKKAATPNLDALAARGALFENAFAQVPLTLPSHITMMTGRYPREHGVRDNARGALAEGFPTLASIFKQRGYQTGAFVAAFVLDSRFGIAQGFDHYEDDMQEISFETQPLEWQISGNVVTDRALAWLNTNKSKPFFCWVHYYDAHDPHAPPPEFRSPDRDPYDGELAFIDTQVKRLTDWLAASGLADRTLIVVVADHGESFGEHGERGHTHFVYNTNLQVPFFFTHAAVIPAGRRIERIVEVVDVFPTLLDLFGFAAPVGLLSRSLVPAFSNGELESAPAYAESHYVYNSYGWAEQRALTTDRWKYISSTKPELFDRRTDPEEKNNLITQKPDVAAELLRALQSRYAQMTPGQAAGASLTPQQRAGLAGLGYLGGGNVAPAEFLTAGKPDPKDMINVITKFRAFTELTHTHKGDEGDRLALPLLESASQDSPGSMIFHYILAGVYLRLKELDRAEASARTAIKLDPTFAPGLSLMGDIHAHKGETDLAIENYENALLLDDQSPDAHARLAETLAGAGRGDEAIAHYRAALKLFPTLAPAHAKLAALLVNRGEFPEALQHFEEAVRLKPEDAEIHHRFGLAYVKAGQFPQAERQFRETLRLAPDHVEANLNLGGAFMEQGRFDEARPLFEKLVDDPNAAAQARFQLGIILAKQGKTDDALKRLEEALKLQPSFQPAIEELSGDYIGKGRIADAVRVLKAGVEAGAADPRILNTLAKILATSRDDRVRDGAAAVSLAQRNLAAVQPENPALLQTLAAAQAEAGQFDKAVETAQRALALAERGNHQPLAEALRAQLALYSASQPFRDPRY